MGGGAGGDTVLTGRSQARVDDGRRHRAEFSKRFQRAELTVDDGAKVDSEVGRSVELRAKTGNLFVGK